MAPNLNLKAFPSEDAPDGGGGGVLDLAAFLPRRPTAQIRCAILGCGMMGQEHCSYIAGYPLDLRVDFLCDPHQPSLDKCCQVLRDFAVAPTENSNDNPHHHQQGTPTLLSSEDELLQHVDEIDLLVIATPNYLHTDSLLRWSQYGGDKLTILVEKPVAVNREQLARLRQAAATNSHNLKKARIWVAMEYRFIPAIAKLLELLSAGPTSDVDVGDIRMVTIRENRYPFLHKVGGWNRDPLKTGDTLVEKCCHFFDLMRLITGQEACLPQVRALAQRGVNYRDEQLHPQQQQPGTGGEPSPGMLIDAAYVTLPFQPRPPSDDEEEDYDDGSHNNGKNKAQRCGSTASTTPAMACLELCMYAEGSRHQEEIIVTGTKGRLEAYLPENKVFCFERPSDKLWSNRSEPPPRFAINGHVYDCSNVRDVFHLNNDGDDEGQERQPHELPTHGGYHYGSTAIEWWKLLGAVRDYDETGIWRPLVSLDDGLRAVEIGLQATEAIVNTENYSENNINDEQPNQQQQQQHVVLEESVEASLLVTSQVANEEGVPSIVGDDGVTA